MLTIACPYCHLHYGLPPALAGKLFTCPSCQTATTVPRPEDIHRPGPSVNTASSVVVTCLRCPRIIHVELDKVAGWLACPSCSLAFNTTSPTLPPLPTPMPLPPQAPPSEDEDESDDDISDLLRRRRQRAKKRSARRWLVGGGVAGVLLLFTGVLAVRYTPRSKVASETPPSKTANDTVRSRTASETPPPKTASARDIILYFKARGLVASDTPRTVDGRPAWEFRSPADEWAVLVEFETELDAKVLPSSIPYGRFALHAPVSSSARYVGQLYHALTGREASTETRP